MKTRPWPIVILAALHVLAPFGSIVLSAYLKHVSIWNYTTALIKATSFLGLVDFFLVVPLAGYAIWRCAKWSYPVFLGIAAFRIYQNYEMWRAFPTQFPIGVFLAMVAVDAILVGYFLMPEVRAPFMNKRLRWWESKPRYPVHFEGKIETGSESHTCMLEDLSEGGAFAKCDFEYPVGNEVKVTFHYEGHDFQTGARVVYHGRGERAGYGLEFHLDSPHRHEIKHLIDGFRKKGLKPRNYVDLKADFKAWFSRLIHTGKGLVPEVPQTRKPSK